MQGHMTQLSCFFFHRTTCNYMYVCQDPFHDTFQVISYIQLHVPYIRYFFFPSVPLSLFPFHPDTCIYVCI